MYSTYEITPDGWQDITYFENEENHILAPTADGESVRDGEPENVHTLEQRCDYCNEWDDEYITIEKTGDILT